MSMAELLLTLMVAVCVFGPTKLPMLARHLARLLHHVQQYRQQWHVFCQQQIQQIQLEDNTKKAALVDRQYMQSTPTQQTMIVPDSAHLSKQTERG